MLRLASGKVSSGITRSKIHTREGPNRIWRPFRSLDDSAMSVGMSNPFFRTCKEVMPSIVSASKEILKLKETEKNF